MRIFLNSAIWCVLEYILLQFCPKKNVEIFMFYIKIIDILYYCALYLGELEHTPQNVFLLCNQVHFGIHFPRTFNPSKNLNHFQKHLEPFTNILTPPEKSQSP